jgi:site-specific DNA-methyltransferase (adenine-specific)
MIDLILGDCLEKMKDIPDGSVDLILTSPPYNMNLRIRNGKYCSRQIVKELTTKYEGFDDNLTMDEYFKFNKDVIDECLRVSDLVFYNVQFLTVNKSALYKLIGHFHDKIKELIIWDKVNAQPAIGEGEMNSRFEAIIVLQGSAPESRKFKSAQFKRGTIQNLWQIKRGKKIINLHGAVFPLELAEFIISNFTKKGFVVLDPFMGTGTTGLACKNLERNFIGIEILETYFQLARKRIKG